MSIYHFFEVAEDYCNTTFMATFRALHEKNPEFSFQNKNFEELMCNDTIIKKLKSYINYEKLDPDNIHGKTNILRKMMSETYISRIKTNNFSDRIFKLENDLLEYPTTNTIKDWYTYRSDGKGYTTPRDINVIILLADTLGESEEEKLKLLNKLLQPSKNNIKNDIDDINDFWEIHYQNLENHTSIKSFIKDIILDCLATNYYEDFVYKDSKPTECENYYKLLILKFKLKNECECLEINQLLNSIYNFVDHSIDGPDAVVTDTFLCSINPNIKFFSSAFDVMNESLELFFNLLNKGITFSYCPNYHDIYEREKYFENKKESFDKLFILELLNVVDIVFENISYGQDNIDTKEFSRHQF